MDKIQKHLLQKCIGGQTAGIQRMIDDTRMRQGLEDLEGGKTTTRADVEVDNNEESEASRRQFMRLGGVAGSTLLLGKFVTGCATAGVVTPARRSLLSVEGETIDLHVAKTRVGIAGRAATATTINGGVPGPEIRLREGQDVLLRVHNGMSVDTSIHWHGLLVPPGMDGVPGVSFPGIKPGATFEYRFPIRQAGTYWYHSHSGFQEQTGIYGPIVIEPREPEPYDVQREYTIVLSDWTFEEPHRVFANLKRYGGYYNYQRRTMANHKPDAKCRQNLDVMATHNGNEHGAGNTMVAKMSKSRITEPGVGLGKDGWRVLTYSQLRRAKPGVSGPGDSNHRASPHGQHGALHVVVRRKTV